MNSNRKFVRMDLCNSGKVKSKDWFVVKTWTLFNIIEDDGVIYICNMMIMTMITMMMMTMMTMVTMMMAMKMQQPPPLGDFKVLSEKFCLLKNYIVKWCNFLYALASLKLCPVTEWLIVSIFFFNFLRFFPLWPVSPGAYLYSFAFLITNTNQNFSSCLHLSHPSQFQINFH